MELEAEQPKQEVPKKSGKAKAPVESGMAVAPPPAPAEPPTEKVSVSKAALYKVVYCLLTDKTSNMVKGGSLRVIAELFSVGGADLQAKLEEIKANIMARS